MDARTLTKEEKIAELTKIVESGMFNQEIFNFIDDNRVLTGAEMNVILTNEPQYYPKYLKKGWDNLAIWYNIQTDLDDKGNDGWELSPIERQIYRWLTHLISEDEFYKQRDLIHKKVDEITVYDNLYWIRTTECDMLNRGYYIKEISGYQREGYKQATRKHVEELIKEHMELNESCRVDNIIIDGEKENSMIFAGQSEISYYYKDFAQPSIEGLQNALYFLNQ